MIDTLVLTAIASATTPLLVAAEPPAAAGATEAAATDTDVTMRVAVVPARVDGELATADRAALVTAVERGLASDSYELVDSPTVAPCETAVCRNVLAHKIGATHIVEMRLAAAPREYSVELRLYKVGEGQPFAIASGSCSICGLAELEQLVASKADGLRQRLTAGEIAPATVAVSSIPSGSKVRIDGRDVGVTPYIGEVPLGPHTIEIVREGYFSETKKISAARGVRERFHSSLTPVPRHSARRLIGWSAFGVGLASLAGGATMLALDGREHGRRCRGEAERDADGDCRYVHKTLGGGIALTIAGATLTATGVTLLLVDRKREKTYPLRASISPRRVALSFRF